jgi:acetyltransferase-like isoleucine patch superfamily enzyme
MKHCVKSIARLLVSSIASLYVAAIRINGFWHMSVAVGRDCWIGSHTVVMADIGEGCVIGGGSVVTKPIPAWSVAVGNPAKVIRSRHDSADLTGADELPCGNEDDKT